jgi:hypothetical protein
MTANDSIANRYSPFLQLIASGKQHDVRMLLLLGQPQMKLLLLLPLHLL